jgi:hypothetical protein
MEIRVKIQLSKFNHNTEYINYKFFMNYHSSQKIVNSKLELKSK